MGLFSKPKLKFAGEVDVGKSMGETFSLNRRYFDDAASYTSRVNQASQQEALNLMEKAMPGVSKVRNLAMQQLTRDMTERGLPSETEAYLAQKAAEKGVTRGTRGDFNKFSALRDLGIEHMKMVEFRRRMATQSMQQLFGLTPKINPMSPASMLLTPGTTLQVQSQNLDRRQAYYNAQAQIDAQHKSNIMGMIAGGIGAVATLGAGAMMAGAVGGASAGMGAGMAMGAGASAAGSALTRPSGAVNYGGGGLGPQYQYNQSNPFG